MSLEPWSNPSALQQGRDTIDGWVTQLSGIMELAKIITPTAFVPKAYQSEGAGPAAVAAAILAGREIGIGPMTAMAHLFIVNGRAGMTAQLMRALVLAQGHHLHVTHKTAAKAVIVGRRLGDPHEQSVEWTSDYARQAGLWGRTDPWKKYPRAMLLARATGELCRDMFPDVIGGVSYTVEELGDLDFEHEPPPKSRASRTVRRSVEASPAAARPPAVAGEVVAADPPKTPAAAAVLEGQGLLALANDNADAWRARAETAEAEVQVLQAELPLEDPPAKPERTGISNAQRAMLMAQLSDLGMREPQHARHHVLSGLAGRRITSTNQLSKESAGAVIDTLARRLEEQMTADELEALIEAGWAGIESAEAGE